MSLEIKVKEYEKYKEKYNMYREKGHTLSKILTPKQYFAVLEDNKKLNMNKILEKQKLYKFSYKVGRKIRDYYQEQYGENIPIWRARYANVSVSFIKDINDYYTELRKSKDSTETGKIISQTFFGSD